MSWCAVKFLVPSIIFIRSMVRYVYSDAYYHSLYYFFMTDSVDKIMGLSSAQFRCSPFGLGLGFVVPYGAQLKSLVMPPKCRLECLSNHIASVAKLLLLGSMKTLHNS